MSSLRKIKNDTIEGNGFTLTIPGIEELVYIEGDQKLNVYIEGGIKNGIVHWHIYWSTVNSWSKPHQEKLLTEVDRNRILNNITDGLKLLNLSYEIH